MLMKPAHNDKERCLGGRPLARVHAPAGGQEIVHIFSGFETLPFLPGCPSARARTKSKPTANSGP